MYEFDLDLAAAVKHLLQQQYFAEFEVIDGLNRHPDFINYYQWLFKKGLISSEELARIQQAIADEPDEN